MFICGAPHADPPRSSVDGKLKLLWIPSVLVFHHSDWTYNMTCTEEDIPELRPVWLQNLWVKIIGESTRAKCHKWTYLTGVQLLCIVNASHAAQGLIALAGFWKGYFQATTSVEHLHIFKRKRNVTSHSPCQRVSYITPAQSGDMWYYHSSFSRIRNFN